MSDEPRTNPGGDAPEGGAQSPGDGGEGSGPVPARVSAKRAERLREVLDRGRSALGLATGALVRVAGEARRTVAVVGKDSASAGITDDGPGLPDALVRRALAGDDPVAVADLSSDGGAETTLDGEWPGCFLGRRVDPGRDYFYVACFTAPEPRDGGFDRAERGVADLVARSLEATLRRESGGPDARTRRVFNETLLDTVPDVLYAFTSDGRIVQWNDEFEAVTGYDPGTIATMGPLDFVAEADRAAVAEAIGGLEPPGAGTKTIESRLLTADGERIPYEFTGAAITDDDGEVVGFAGAGRDVSARREYEQTLTALHDATRELVRADDEAAVCETVVETVDDVLDISVTGVFLFDEGRNVLEPVAQTDDAHSIIDEAPTFGPGDGIAWEVFMAGDIAVFDDVSEAEAVHNPDTEVRSELFVPLGEHGVLLAGTTEVGSFEDRTVELADLLAANAEAALDDLARKRELDARDERLARQHRQLQRLNEVNERVRKIGHALVGADTPEEIRRLVCERLVEAEAFAFGWVAERTADGVASGARAGWDQGYPDEVTGGASGEFSAEPVRQAADSRDAVVVDRVGEGFQGDPWRRAALSREFQSVVAVPLDHGGVPHGVLGVYAEDADAFDEETLEVLLELADMVAQALAVAKRRRARASREGVELVVGLEDDDCPLLSVAETVGADVTVQRVVPAADDRTLLYGTAAVDGDEFDDAVDVAPGVASGRVLGNANGLVSGGADGVRFQLAVSERVAAETVSAFGGDCERIAASDGSARLVARLPGDADVREFVSLLEDDYAEVEVLAQRTDGTDAADDRPLADLTDRQREALLAAYHAGFFEWPRESSGEDVADALGVAQPTFVEHLRRAESKLLDALLDDR